METVIYHHQQVIFYMKRVSNFPFQIILTSTEGFLLLVLQDNMCIKGLTEPACESDQ